MAEVLSFGCRLNIFESAVMKQAAEAGGAEDALLINTCAVTNEAERQARQAIRKAARDNPARPIIVSGCAAQLRPEAFAALPGVVKVLGNSEKLSADSYSRNAPIIVSDIMSLRETAGHLLPETTEHARAFVEIQQGCDHRCTFCIIPFARGNNRSVPVGHIITQIAALAARGVAEVVLTGVDITGYGADLPGKPTLGNLVLRILKLVPALARLRLSSIDVAEIDAELWQAIAEQPRLMPHLHLSLQAGDDLILKRMKRRHTRQQAVAFADAVRRIRPDIVLGADLIAGFPTETEEQFSQTLALLDDCNLTYLHIFPFSARSGTPAARMPQLSGDVRRMRAAQLRARAQQRLEAYYAAYNAQETTVVIEQNNTGHSPHYVPLKLSGDRAETGQILRVRTQAWDGTHVVAERI